MAASSPAPTSDDAPLADHLADSVAAVAEFHQDHYRRASRVQKTIDRLTDRLGRPKVVIGLFVLIAIWAGLATLKAGGGINQPSLMWLELLTTVGALLVSLLILVTQRRQDQLAERRAQLMLELALLADRKSAKIIALLEELRRDQPDVADRIDEESNQMATPADPKTVLAAIDQHATPSPD